MKCSKIYKMPIFCTNKNEHQPILWKVLFKGVNNSEKFRTEIAKTVESDNLF